MNSGVRIIKRGRDDDSKGAPPVGDVKTERQREREVVSTVKGWIAEWEQRRTERLLKPAA